MNFIIIRLIFIVASSITSFLLFQSYQKGGNKNTNIRDFSAFFLLLAFYTLFLVTSIVTDDLMIIAYGYDIAVAMYFIMIALSMKITMSFLEVGRKTTLGVIGLILFTGLGVVIYQVITPNIPEMTDIPGFIIWNLNPIVLFITGVAGFIGGNTWAYIFWLNFDSSKTKISKIKSILIMISGSSLGFSSLAHFHPSELSFFLSFAFAFIGIFGLLALSIIRFKNKES